MVLLPRYPLAPSHRLAGATAGAGVRARALTMHRQVTTVPDAAVAADLDQPLDVLPDLAAQVALRDDITINQFAQPRDLIVGQVTHTGLWIDARLLQQLRRGRASNPENGR